MTKEIPSSGKNQATHINELVMQDRLEEALKMLASHEKPEVQDEAVLLISKLNVQERNDRQGVIRNDDNSIERSKLTKAILELKRVAYDGATKRSDSIPQDNAGSTKKVPDEPTQGGKRKILFMAANPKDIKGIQVDFELSALEDQFNLGKARDAFEFLRPKFAVDSNAMVRALMEEPAIVHFAGHGRAEGIIIVDKHNNSKPISPEALCFVFEDLQAITELIILNACYSAAQAQGLSLLGIYVIGTNLAIKDDASVSFSEGLYMAIGDGAGIEKAFRIARKKVALDHSGTWKDAFELWKDGQRLC